MPFPGYFYFTEPMAIFRKIHTSFWSDPFIQSLSPEKKYFFLYLLTNEKTKQCGIYEITKRQISYDTGYNIDTVSILLKYFISEKKIMFSEATNEIAIKNWNKYNGNKSTKVQKLVDEELSKVKDGKLIQYLYSTDTVSILYPQEEEEIEVEQEEEIEEKKMEVFKKTKEPILLPFAGENFKKTWDDWKLYKKKEHRFSYKSENSEMTGLKSLFEMSGGNENSAIRIIEQSITNGWKGLFHLKNNSNGITQKSNPGRTIIHDEL